MTLSRRRMKQRLFAHLQDMLSTRRPRKRPSIHAQTVPHACCATVLLTSAQSLNVWWGDIECMGRNHSLVIQPLIGAIVQIRRLSSKIGLSVLLPLTCLRPLELAPTILREGLGLHLSVLDLLRALDRRHLCGGLRSFQTLFCVDHFWEFASSNGFCGCRLDQ